VPESLPPELLELRARMRVFVEQELRPLEAGLDLDAPIPEEIRREVRERSRAHGFFAMTQPAAYGGSEAGPLALVTAREALAAGNSPLGRDVFGPGPGVLHHAGEDLRARYLEPVLRGDLHGAFAFTEPGGPDAPERATWARREGDDLIVTGRKSFVTGGASADFYQALVNVDEDQHGPGGTALVLIDRETPGVRIAREFRSMEGGDHVDLHLEGVRVPLANVIGAIGEGMPRALAEIGDERLDTAATACGLAMWAVEFVAEHITAPHRHGGRLGDREGVRLRYADLRIETYAARAMLYRTARLAEAGEETTNERAATRVFCAEVAGRVVDGAVQLAGGQALVRGHPLERLYRRVRSLRFTGGASDILRLTVARGAIEFEAGRI
jgi:acyl-CoA dehydrogenase